MELEKLADREEEEASVLRGRKQSPEPGQSWPSWRFLVFLQTSSGRSGVGGPNLSAHLPA